MATRCGHSSKDDTDNLCDRCEEHAQQIHRELYGYFCTHSGQTTGEAVSLLRTPVAEAVVPVGWPPLAQTLARIIDLKILINV